MDLGFAFFAFLLRASFFQQGRVKKKAHARADFPIFRFSDFSIFRFFDFSIFRFFDFSIFLGSILGVPLQYYLKNPTSVKK
jgi:hypothetical protein